MKKGKIDTSQNRNSDKSPRGSISDKSPLLSAARTSSFPRAQFASVEDELAHLPYKEYEIEMLAKEIGIDYDTEKDKYLWFLVQVVNLDLPPGWMKEEDPSGIVYYLNPTENISSTKHPMIAKFRSLFNEILENEISGRAKTLALKEKVQKFEQQIDIISPSPKKPVKELKLDKAKKFKAAATAIAMTTALAHKTHKDSSPAERVIPRPIPEQPLSIVDSEKTKQKFNKVKEMLERRRTVQEKRVNEVDNLVKTEDILNVCKQYYIDLYGSCHKDAPPELTQLEAYDLVDPMELIEAARLFNVRSNQPYLFWVLRAYCGLPLPEYWTKMYDTNMQREIYYNSCHDVKISVKPCYFYVMELINYIKQESIRDKEPFLNFSNKVTLCDKLGRQYDVDLAAMIKDLIEKQNVERKNYFTYHQKKEPAKDEVQKVTKKRKKDEFNPNYSDAHFIEIAKQLGIDLNIEIHLLMTIEDFVRNKEGLERWYFRQGPEGQSFWVNHEQQKAVNRYPYLNDLKKAIDEVRAMYKNSSSDAQKHLKSDFNLIKTLFRKYPEDVAKKMLQDEAKNYLEFFLKMKSDGQINSINLETKGYNLTNLMRKIGMQLSKQDIMDLLFYCPFDFTHYIGEDFLRSSENYLLRKIHLKLGGEKKKVVDEEDEGGQRDGSFDSQGSNDSAKNIKLKIEDSKKLLDLASNIKGLNFDHDKKREFMKLLIDFDQKYGDRDLVDALENDVTGKLQEGASSAKSLANSIKNTIGKTVNGKDVDESSSSLYAGADKAQRFLLDPGRDSPRVANKNLLDSQERDENRSYGKLRRVGDVLVDPANPTKTIGRLKQDDKSIFSSNRDLRLQKNAKSDSVNKGEDDGYGFGNDGVYSAGLAGNKKSKYDRKARLQRAASKAKFKLNENGEIMLDENGIPIREEGRGEENTSGKKSKRHNKRKHRTKDANGNVSGSHSRSGVSSASNSNSNAGEDDEDTDEEEDDSDEFSEISESDNDDEVEGEDNAVIYTIDKNGRVIRMKKKKHSNTSKTTTRPSAKLVYDEDGKIIFTNKRTQRLLEELAEEEFRLSSRHKYKKRQGTSRFSSQQPSLDDDNDANSIFGQIKPQPQTFEDHKIVYHEVIMENGEKKIVSIRVKPKKRRGDRRRSNTMSPESLEEKSRSPRNVSGKETPMNISSSKLRRNASKRRVMEPDQSREEDRGLPMVIGSSYKNPNQNRTDVPNIASKFDPNALIESLNRYNVEALDEAYYKEERRKEEQLESAYRISAIDDSKMGDATGLSNSRSLMTPLLLRPRASDPRARDPVRIPQTYRNLAPGLQHLDLVRNRNTYEKTGKQGVWTHVEVFEMKKESNEPQKTTREKHQRAASESTKVPVSARTSNNSPRGTIGVENTFFTPFRQGNLGLKRFIEYMSYLNTLVFIKKLDTLITNFLMKQFAVIQQNALGISFNSNDPKFRSTFKKRYNKLIRQLRENLLKKKDFLNNIYSKVVNSTDDLPDNIFQSMSHIRDVPATRDSSLNKPPLHQSFLVGQNPSGNLNKSQSGFDINIKQARSSSMKASQSQQNLHLPKVSARGKGTDNFRISQRGFNTPRAGSEDEAFADNNIRKTEGGKEETPLQDIKDKFNKTRRGQLTIQTQREHEANKILKALNEHDQESYRHYWNILGDPLKLDSSVAVSRSAPPIGIQPYHVLLMARRLGLQVHNSEEHDLAWIAFLALTVKLPSSTETNLMITSPRDKTRYQKVCNMKPGEHPGDKYFKTVLIYNQLRRRILLENMTMDDQTKYIKSQAWVKLKEENGSIYYHNFLTKQKTINLPSDQKDIISRVAALSLRPDIKEKLKLTNQTIMENDHLLNFFKNKLPVN